MIKQKDIFKKSEANAWFHRNKKSHHLCEADWLNDDIVNFIKQNMIKPKEVLEIGCANGKRLHILHSLYKINGTGIDPSIDAIEDGKKRYSNFNFSVGTADELPYKDASFDTIILSFFLLMTDRIDLFKIAYEIDRCLEEGGTLIIREFMPPFAYKNNYGHLDGLHSYKMDYTSMFTWNPAYTEIAKVLSSHSLTIDYLDNPDERVAITALYKNNKIAYPLNPLRSNIE